MIKSMTGFGQGSFEGADFKVSLDVRTVNNRYLDTHLRLPQEFSNLENRLKKQVQETLKRGRVDITVSITQTRPISMELNRPLIRGYLESINLVREEFGLSGDLDINGLIRLPGVFQNQGGSTPTDDTVPSGVQAALSQALTALQQMRAVEGKELGTELASRLGIIEAQIPTIESNASQLPTIYRERLEKRIKDLMSERGTVDETRLAQEVAYLAERSDITEELARLRSHVSQFGELISKGGEVGKKLDFILQEMNREANTILSKSNNISIGDAAIIIKTEVEKLREQVQNVE
jgi:uncharacterized protein (TIGR00255 family)